MIRKIFKGRWIFLIISIIPYLKQIQDNLDYKIKKIKILNTYIDKYIYTYIGPIIDLWSNSLLDDTDCLKS